MRNVATMMQRELGAYFLSPIAYAIMFVFLFSVGLAFGLGVFYPGAEASLRLLLDPWLAIILLFVLPMLTMRLLSEEFRSGTIETLLTIPVTETEVVVGKFLGALAVFAILLLAMLICPILLRLYGPVDPLLLLCNYLGVLLLGALYIAVGLFFSACSKHQIIAVLFSFALLALLTFAAPGLAQKLPAGWMRVALQQVSIRTHFHGFVRGLFDVNHVIFFITTTALFLFLTVKRLEMRRWQ